MKTQLLLSITLFITGLIQAQPVFEWARNLGGANTDVGNEITSDAEGNVIVCGRFQGTIDADPGPGTTAISSNGGFDMLVVKFSPTGDFIWAKNAGGTGADQYVNVACDNQGNVILTGLFAATVDLDPNIGVQSLTAQGETDIMIMKLSADGETEWIQTINGTATESTGGLACDASGNIYACGGFTGTTNFPGANSLVSAGENDVFVLKLNADGVFQWVKQIGSTSFDYAYDVDTDTQNNVVVGGRFRNTVDFNPDAGVANGTSAGANDGFIVKLNSSGSYIWHQTFGGTGFDEVWAVAADNQNNVITYGYFSGTADLNPTSTVENFVSNGSDDLFIQKYDSQGNFLWVKVFGGSELENSYDIDTDSDGGIIATGDFFNTVDFDPGSGVANSTSAGNNDIFYLKLDANGNYVWTAQIGATFSQAGYSVFINSANEMLGTGTFSNNVDFNPGPATAFMNALDFNIFVLKFQGTASCELPVINTVTPSLGAACDGESVSIAISGNLNDATQWVLYKGNCGTEQVSTTSSNSLVFEVEGGESYFLRGEGGCVTASQSTCAAINLNALPAYNSSEFFNACAGEPFTFPDGSSQTLTESTIYTSEFNSVNGCDSTITTTVNVTVINVTVVLEGEVLVAQGFVQTEGNGIEWIDCNTQEVIPGANDATFSFPLSGGSFAAIITEPGCTVTTNCATITDIENKTENYSIYPNPFNEIIHIGNSGNSSQIELYSAEGKLLKTGKINELSTITVNTNDLPAGIYFLHLNANGIKSIKKLCKMAD